MATVVVFDCNGTYLYLEGNNELGCVNDLSPSPQGMTDSEVKNTLGSFDVSNFNIVLSISNRTVLSRPSQRMLQFYNINALL